MPFNKHSISLCSQLTTLSNIASSQCKSHDAGSTTQPMNEAYGAQHSGSTRGMMFQDRCLRVVRNKTHFHGTLSSTTFPAAARQKPLTRCNSNGRLRLAFWLIRARRQSLIPGFEMGTQMFKVFSCSVQTCHLPALTASVRTTSRNASCQESCQAISFKQPQERL